MSAFNPFALFVMVLHVGVLHSYPPPCDHPIYCIGGNGSLLHTVQVRLPSIHMLTTFAHGVNYLQMARIFNDSKTFVDRPTKSPTDQILHNFQIFMQVVIKEGITKPCNLLIICFQDHEQNPTNEAISSFVEDNFFEEGDELEEVVPDDWAEDPAFLESIADPDYREFARDIHARWRELCRRVKPSVDPDRNSLIHVDKPFVVPGGRFREMYYWDSYWTILGLLQSEMHDTVKGSRTIRNSQEVW